MKITSLLVRTLGACALTCMALSTQAQTVPEGSIGINYSRCDGNFDKWGLHAWKNPGIPLPNIEWPRPMEPTGKGDFGVYWHLPLAEFGSSGTVNYIIHQGDSKEQGGRDMKFDGKTIKEIWVNSGDRKTYFSLADAQAARAESPCK